MVKVNELVRIRDAIIVDIRTYYEYSLGHIESAISIPYYNLLNNYSHYLSKYNHYYLYCEYGFQSEEISKRLNQFGYNTDSLDGGYKEYLKYFDIK